MMREREEAIREEYDKVLASKLAEQYDCFVRFTTDQIQQRLNQSSLPSCKYPPSSPFSLCFPFPLPLFLSRFLYSLPYSPFP